MRETQVHHQVFALLLHTVANAVHLQLLLVALGYANDHVVDQGTGQAVQRAVLLLVIRTGNKNLVALYVTVMLG